MAYTIDIMNYLPGALDQLVAKLLDPAKAAPVVGRAGRNCMVDHFLRLDQTRANKQGFPRQHFWAGAAKSVYYQVLPDGVILGISKVGARLLLEGGTVTPGKGTSRTTGKPTRLLTIPACAEAYGKRAGEFHNLKFGVVDGIPALIEREASRVAVVGRGKKRKVQFLGEVGGKVFFWLARKVTIKADPTVIPTKEALTDAVRAGLQSYIRSQGDRLS